MDAFCIIMKRFIVKSIMEKNVGVGVGHVDFIMIVSGVNGGVRMDFSINVSLLISVLIMTIILCGIYTLLHLLKYWGKCSSCKYHHGGFWTGVCNHESDDRLCNYKEKTYKEDKEKNVCNECYYCTYCIEIDDFMCISHEGCIMADDRNIDNY